ncbi:MAG: XRE family transcriptional regulator [Pseudobdellovibrionaceae bacterium]
MKFPSGKELEKIRKKLEKSEGSLLLPPNATSLEKLRYEICRQFVIYQREHNLKCKELSKLVGVDESLMSKILRYRHDRFSTDKLIDLLSKIYPKHHLVLKVS